MSSVSVTNISPKTTEKELRDFFSYCGKIESLSMTPSSGEEGAPLSATITFERESAAETARLLDNTELGGNAVHVESTASLEQLSRESEKAGHDAEGEDLRQEDKSKAAILAEYLSHGYAIGDQALKKGIELDEKHGVSQGFKKYIQKLEAKFHPVGTARSVDEAYQISSKATSGYNVANRYFQSALGTPTGQKVRDFYVQSSKQILDIHSEARRLADLRKAEQEGQAKSTNPSGGSSAGAPSAGAPTSGKQTCTCGGNEGQCTCAPGTCQCDPCKANRAADAQEKVAQ